MIDRNTRKKNSHGEPFLINKILDKPVNKPLESRSFAL